MNDSNKSIIVNYETDKNKVIDLSAVTFLFQFYSVAIDQLFKFNIKLSRGREIIQNNPSIDEIPKCLVKNTNCSFITKDSAIKIAIADSILFRDNLKIDLLKEFKKDVFYWRVIGSPKKGTSNPKNTPIQRRIIHSITGKIVRKD